MEMLKSLWANKSGCRRDWSITSNLPSPPMEERLYRSTGRFSDLQRWWKWVWDEGHGIYFKIRESENKRLTKQGEGSCMAICLQEHKNELFTRGMATPRVIWRTTLSIISGKPKPFQGQSSSGHFIWNSIMYPHIGIVFGIFPLNAKAHRVSCLPRKWTNAWFFLRRGGYYLMSTTIFKLSVTGTFTKGSSGLYLTQTNISRYKYSGQ